jgi:superfamily II DNA helicase RecQ
VRSKAGTLKAVAQDMYSYIASIGHLDSTGIVYCYSKKETMELSGALSALGLSCDYYHSDVTPEKRQRLHHQWVQNKVRVIVATNAFGLGINKPDVRYVLHHTFPAGISMYYQEAGRAGRDGLKAHCCLWYSSRDLSRQSIRVYAKQDMVSSIAQPKGVERQDCPVATHLACASLVLSLFPTDVSLVPHGSLLSHRRSMQTVSSELGDMKAKFIHRLLAHDVCDGGVPLCLSVCSWHVTSVKPSTRLSVRTCVTSVRC